jgi:hypothetical protein
METELVCFWSICFVSLFIGKIISHYLFPEPAVFLEAYGGCECGRDSCKKIDAINLRGKRYRRLDIQESKMSYKYCKIYNVSKGEWATDVSGNDNPKAIWETNEWDENDALVGFFSDSDSDFHNVIFCRPGYAIYVQSDSDYDKTAYNYDGTAYRIPPAMLVNLNDAFDTEFVHSKNYPEEMDLDSDSDSEASDESDSDSEVSDSDSEDSDSEYEPESDDDDDDEPMNKQTYIKAKLEDNQPVIDFLCRCHDATDKRYKKAAYMKAIDEIKYYYEPIASQNPWKPCSIGPSIERKVREFLEGFPEDDIINS